MVLPHPTESGSKIAPRVLYGEKDGAGFSGKQFVFFKYWKGKADENETDGEIKIGKYRYNVDPVLIQNLMEAIKILDKKIKKDF